MRQTERKHICVEIFIFWIDKQIKLKNKKTKISVYNYSFINEDNCF